MNPDLPHAQAASGWPSAPGRASYTAPGMEAALQRIVEGIHASGRRCVLAITGGGSGAIADLLRVPGGSRVLVEAIVPYEQGALVEFLGREPEQACSPETAVAMARRALARARERADQSRLVGIGVTASLVSDRPKQGDHRCHVAFADGDRAEVVSVVLEKGRRDREAEEDLVARVVLVTLARACGVAVPDVSTLLGAGDRGTVSPVALQGVAGDPVERLLAGLVERVTILPDGQCVTGAPVPRGVLAGSFNPLHAGHIELARVAADMLGGAAAFELAVLNADKPPLGREEVRQRIAQFAWRQTLELTRASTFREKARLLPGVTFVVGADTAERIVHPRYYGGRTEDMLAAFDEIARHGCRFLVAGRANDRGRFVTLAEVSPPARFAELFAQIPEERFRRDVSSTALRQRRS